MHRHLNITGLPPNLSPTVTAPVVSNSSVSFRFALAAGTYTFSTTFNGSATLAYSASSTITETVVPATTNLTLSATPNPSTQNQSVTFTSVWTSPLSTETPNGTITFLDGSTPIATAPFPANVLSNTATITAATSTLTPGTHIITASYAGNSNFLPTTSAPVTVIINPNDYTIATPTPHLIIPTEHHLAMNVGLSSIGTFTDQIALACTGLPAWATCTFKQNTISLSAGSSTSTTLIVDTDFILYYAANHTPASRTGTILALIFPAGILSLFLSRRRKLPIRLALFLLLIAAGTLSLNGCSGRYPPSTQPGAYTFNITGHGASTNVSHFITIDLTVTHKRGFSCHIPCCFTASEKP